MCKHTNRQIDKQFWYKNSPKSRIGFTLVEVVVAVAIIGTLASLAINTYFVSGTSQKNQYVAGLKKVYAELSYATDQLKTNNGGTLEYLFKDRADVVTQYCKYLKCSKICNAGAGISGGCFNPLTAIKNLNGSPATWPDGDYIYYYTFVLSDGTFVLSNLSTVACNDLESGLLVCGYFLVDINGLKGPNTYGRDLFQFAIIKDKITSFYKIPSGDDYAGIVLRDGKMMY